LSIKKLIKWGEVDFNYKDNIKYYFKVRK
jgi:hypothetical protein